MVTSPFHTPAGLRVPAVTADEMRAVDRVAVDEVGIALLQMMENAGRTLASHVFDVGDGSALVVAGNGGNGGGGLACARHLANHGVRVEIVLDRPPEELTGATAHQHRILAEMGIPVHATTDPVAGQADHSVVVDALIGYGLTGTIQGAAASLIQRMNDHRAPVVSLDVPSGVNVTTGAIQGSAVDPERTVTLALPKVGLIDRDASLFLADISVPHTVYERLEIAYEPPFGQDTSVELLQ